MGEEGWLPDCLPAVAGPCDGGPSSIGIRPSIDPPSPPAVPVVWTQTQCRGHPPLGDGLAVPPALLHDAVNLLFFNICVSPPACIYYHGMGADGWTNALASQDAAERVRPGAHPRRLRTAAPGEFVGNGPRRLPACLGHARLQGRTPSQTGSLPFLPPHLRTMPPPSSPSSPSARLSSGATRSCSPRPSSWRCSSGGSCPRQKPSSWGRWRGCWASVRAHGAHAHYTVLMSLGGE